MIVKDNTALKACRDIGFCEYCGRSDMALHAAHLVARGMGNGSRCDAAINLICLCAACHADSHAGRLRFSTLAEIVVKREVWRMLREPRSES